MMNPKQGLGTGVKVLGVIGILALVLVLGLAASALMVYGIYASISAFAQERVMAGVLWGMLASFCFSFVLGAAVRRQS